jgi:hypothetical protein
LAEGTDSEYVDASPTLKDAYYTIEWMEQADEIEKSKWNQPR